MALNFRPSFDVNPELKHSVNETGTNGRSPRLSEPGAEVNVDVAMADGLPIAPVPNDGCNFHFGNSLVGCAISPLERPS